VAVFPITTAAGSASNGALGSPVANGSLNYWPLSLPSAPADVIVPTAINVLNSGASLFVTAYDSSVTPNVGYVFGFSIASSGALTPLNGGAPHNMGVGGMGLGIHPSAIASYATSNGAYIYVTDSTNGIVVSYSIASGILTKISDTPTGNEPSAIAVDPAYPYAYVANSLDGNIEAYSISSSGALTFLGGSTNPVTYATGLQPVAIGIDPSMHQYLYTLNFLGSNVSGFELNSDGTLFNSQNSPYASNAQPTSVAAIPHNGSKQ
jgi:DNA-binding beta-propeller fold protein YncE